MNALLVGDRFRLELGRLRATAALAAVGQAGESPLFLLDYLLRIVRVAVLLALWRTILAGQGTVEGLSLGTILTYTLIAEVFAEQLAVRTELDLAIWNGTIVGRFLRPSGLVGQIAAETVGRWLFGLLTFSMPLFLLAPALGVNPWPAGTFAGLLFAIGLVLAAAIGFALDFVFAALLVILDQNVWVVQSLRGALTALLSGAVLPLALLPWGIGDVLAWLPFASLAAAPLQIYTGVGDPALLLARQAVWAILIWPFALWLWRTSRERLVAYGG